MNKKAATTNLRYSELSGIKADIYNITADCEDQKFMTATLDRIEKALTLFKHKTDEDMSIRNQLFDYMYHVTEIMYPESHRRRFDVLKRMVRNIQSNSGKYDHHPLNIAARYTSLMTTIPADERYKLILEINKKTIDHKTYNYTYDIQKISDDYKKWKKTEAYNKREKNVERYEEIRAELMQNPDNQTQIKLYQELLPLVNSNDWPRLRKLGEKKTIYNHLIRLYRDEGMLPQMYEAEAMREKFVQAAQNTINAAIVKGFRTDRYK